MPLSIRLTDDEERRLDALAAQSGRSKTFYVREAIRRHLEELEEQAWAEEAARQHLASEKKTRPIAEVWTELGV